MLRDLTGFQANETTQLNSIRIYTHLGYTLLHLTDLLLFCDYNLFILTKLIDKIISTCCSLMQSVTVDVFCYWAEIEFDCQQLQTVIAWKAYAFIEKYQKYKPAAELIQMFRTIARKPQTINELIRAADVSTMIRMINKVTPEQKAWFQALVGTQMKDPEALECAKRWAHLSTTEDVTRLLNLAISSNDTEIKKLTMQCASNLSLEDLILVVSRNFHSNGCFYVLKDNVQQQLMSFFNKLKGVDSQDTFLHEAYLLFLQNPTAVLLYMFDECLKNQFFTKCLKPFFYSLKHSACIYNFGTGQFNTAIEVCKLNEQNVECYITLLNALRECEFFTVCDILTNIFLKNIEMAFNEKHYADLKYLLIILNDLNVSLEINLDTEKLYETFFELLQHCRCKFLEFDYLKHEIVREVVRILKRSKKSTDYEGDILDKEDSNLFLKYYRSIALKEFNAEITMLNLFCPQFELNKYGLAVSSLMKVLPCCVLEECLTLANELNIICGIEKTAEIFSDLMILLCQLQETQEEKGVTATSSALKCYIGYYGIIIKDKIQIQAANTIEHVCIAKHICRLIKHLPKSMKQSEGVTLASLLSEDVLKSLANDPQFLSLIVSINDPIVCKMIAQKMVKKG